MATKKKSKAKSKGTKKKVKKTSRALTAKQKAAIKKEQAQVKKDQVRAKADIAKVKEKARIDKLKSSSSIGCFGSLIKFEVSSKKILTFSNLKRTQAGRWAVHPIVLKAPKSEFLGPDLTEVSMDVTLSAEHGVKPRHTINAIENAVRSGTVDNIAIGGKVFGHSSHKWYIESVSETWDEIWNQGELVRAKITLNFKEYV